MLEHVRTRFKIRKIDKTMFRHVLYMMGHASACPDMECCWVLSLITCLNVLLIIVEICLKKSQRKNCSRSPGYPGYLITLPC